MTSPLYREFIQAPDPKKPRKRFKSPIRGAGGAPAKGKKIRRPNSKRIKELIKNIVDTEMGETAHQRQSFYESHLKNLSKKELTRLLDKINRLSKDLLYSKETQEVGKFRDFTQSVILEKLRNSQRQIERLSEMITRRLEAKGKPRTEEALIENFGDLIITYNNLVETGGIIPEKRTETGISFITSILKPHPLP